ncbi:hypothetical protein [Geotalea sp. SG265]|uniref:hypothetical protein n=1 Tax=Geotalea sp. SG265 TaxID=2922867 RepID=UPI001FAEFCAF|nr:hypothetical protein [Geotalea sp. SG265]
MAERKKYDEQRQLPSPWEWVIITMLSLALIAYSLIAYRFVLEGQRYWDFGQLPDTPAESIYSTEEPPAPDGRLQRQIHKLPEAQPENPPKPHNKQLRERSPNR